MTNRMSKNLLLAALLAMIVFGVWRCNTRWKRMAARVANKECDCFSKANVSLSKPVENVLDKIENEVEHGQFIGPSRYYLDAYDQLSLTEKKELKEFALHAFDASTQLGACLEKVHLQENGLGILQTGKLFHEQQQLFEKNTECKLSFYYEHYVIEGAKNLTLQDSSLNQ